MEALRAFYGGDLTGPTSLVCAPQIRYHQSIDMGIFDRMGRVISSNVNAVLDRVEDDPKLIAQALEDMSEQVRRARQEVVTQIASEKTLRKKADEKKADVERWDRRAELAVKSGDEALAREALKQKKRATADAEAVEVARVEARDTALKMKEELIRMEKKVEELNMRKGTLASKAAQARSASTELGTSGGSSAFASFRELEQKVEGREAQANAMAEVEDAIRDGGLSKEDVEAQFRALERGESTGGAKGGTGAPDEIDAELAAIKKRLRV